MLKKFNSLRTNRIQCRRPINFGYHEDAQEEFIQRVYNETNNEDLRRELESQSPIENRFKIIIDNEEEEFINSIFKSLENYKWYVDQ